MLLPFLMIPLAIPIAPKGRPKFEWELSAAQRRKRKKPNNAVVRLRAERDAEPAHGVQVSAHAWNMSTSHSSY